MPNTTLIVIGVVIPLSVLLGSAGTFIWITERRRRRENTIVREIPHRPRIASYLHRNKEYRYSTRIEDGIEVCSPRPSFTKHKSAGIVTKAEYELPSLQIGGTRTDSAVQSPTDNFDQLSELEGTLGKQPYKRPSKARLRPASSDDHIGAVARKDLSNRASLQPGDVYSRRQSLQPIATSNNRSRRPSSSPGNEAVDMEDKDGESSPSLSAISDLSVPMRQSQRLSSAPELPAWIKRMSIEESAEKTWKIDGEIRTPVETLEEKCENV